MLTFMSSCENLITDSISHKLTPEERGIIEYYLSELLIIKR